MVKVSLKALVVLVAGTGAVISGPGVAGMSNTATTFGILPSDIATAQSLSLFSNQVSATYYNPAYLARDKRGELTGGLFHAEPSLEVESHGGINAPTRDGSVLDDTPSQQVLIGMKKDLSFLTKYDHPIMFGFMAGVEKFGKEMMAFQSETSNEGQFFNYGRQPLFLNLGAGTRLWRGIDVGAAVRVTLHADATMQTQSDLAGNTEREKIDVSAQPVMVPIVSASMNWGETWCSRSPCWMDKLDSAIAYKGFAKAKTKVEANAVIPGTIPSPGLDLAIRTISGFQPEIITAGAQYRFGKLRVGATAELQRWSRLDDELQRDTIKDQANLQFRDSYIPRLGAVYQLNDSLSLMTGVAYEKSPLKSSESEEVNYLDNDRIVVGLGGSLVIKNPPVLAWPIQLDFGYQYHHLRERDFLLTGTTPDNLVYEEDVTASGDVHVFSGSFTLKF
ncbi:MAG: OmpP1/FadL family transporter [Alcanivoracaceae bacterium]